MLCNWEVKENGARVLPRSYPSQAGVALSLSVSEKMAEPTAPASFSQKSADARRYLFNDFL